MPWIKPVPPAEAEGRLKALYDRVKGPDGRVDNILTVHGLRPHTLEGHLALYKNVLHHYGNRTPKWFLEAVGLWVSLLNRCAYCVEHHYAGMTRLVGDDARARRIRRALEAGTPDRAFSGKELAALDYARELTEAPAGETVREALENLRAAGADDGEILEINQVVAYFAYANRVVLGLGVTTDGDVLGLSPNDDSDPENWSHR